MPHLSRFCTVFLFVVFLAIACTREAAPTLSPCSRIVSTAPNLTELFFELGIGSRLVGVTRYCSWPPETRDIPKIGGWYDPSAEAIAALKPDTLFHLPEQQQVADAVKKTGTTPVALPGKTIEDVLEAARLIGAHCHIERTADRFAARFLADMERATVTGKTTEPRVLVVVGRSPETGPVGTLFVAGKDSFHGALLSRAGAVNACDLPLPYPRISAEGVIAMNPDVIIELHADENAPALSPDDWKRLEAVTAVKNGRIHRLTGDRFFIPGPRIPLILEELSRLIYPDAAEKP